MGVLGRRAAVTCGIGALFYGVASVVLVLLDTEALTFPSWSQSISGYSTIPTLAILTPPSVRHCGCE